MVDISFLIKRTISGIIDIAAVFILGIILTMLILLTSYVVDLIFGVELISILWAFIGLIIIIPIWSFFAFLESSRGGSFGKLVLGLKVQNLSGGKISFSKGLIRVVIWNISFIFAMPIFLIVLFTKNHRCVHDIITKTIVVKK